MLSAFISSVLSYPAMRLASQPVHQRYVHSGPLVLGAAPLKSPAPTADRDQTVSRRFEPSSRTTLNGEQPYPWDRLQPQDVMSRHRGAKLRRRCELLGGISLLSPEYLLSVERWPFHTEPPDHYDLLSHLLDLWVSQSSLLLPLHYEHDVRPCLGDLRTPPLPFRRRPPQSNCLPCTVPDPDSGAQVRTSTTPGWYFNVGSTRSGDRVSLPPTYPTQVPSKSNAKLQ
jgi:hypothetical protein